MKSSGPRIERHMLLDSVPAHSKYTLGCAVGLGTLAAVSCFGLGAVTRALGWALIALAVLPFALNCASKRVSARFAALVVPRAMALIDARFAAVRKELLKGISGRVLDVGAGGGPYIKYLAAAGSAVTELVELEPNVHMHGTIRASIAAASPLPFTVRIVDTLLQDLPGDCNYDAILLGNVLCEVPDQAAALAEMNRLLKPNGRVYFCEHVRSHGWLGGVQDALNWWWCVVSDGCHCNRQTLSAIRAQKSWAVTHWAFDRAVAIPLIQDFVVGIAVKQSEGSQGAESSQSTVPPKQGSAAKRTKPRVRRHVELSYDET